MHHLHPHVLVKLLSECLRCRSGPDSCLSVGQPTRLFTYILSIVGYMAAKRAPTAFFIFSEEQREGTRAECQAQAEPGAKVSVGPVAKAIGEKWRALTDEEKAVYKEKAAERTKALASAAAEHALTSGVLLCPQHGILM